MKRKLVLLMAGTMVTATVLSGCGTDKKAEAAKEETKTEASAENAGDGKTFTVGFNASYPPYGYIDKKRRVCGV